MLLELSQQSLVQQFTNYLWRLIININLQFFAKILIHNLLLRGQLFWRLFRLWLLAQLSSFEEFALLDFVNMHVVVYDIVLILKISDKYLPVGGWTLTGLNLVWILDICHFLFI